MLAGETRCSSLPLDLVGRREPPRDACGAARHHPPETAPLAGSSPSRGRSQRRAPRFFAAWLRLEASGRSSIRADARIVGCLVPRAFRLEGRDPRDLTSDALCRPAVLPQEPHSRVRCDASRLSSGHEAFSAAPESASPPHGLGATASPTQDAFCRIDSRPFRSSEKPLEDLVRSSCGAPRHPCRETASSLLVKDGTPRLRYPASAWFASRLPSSLLDADACAPSRDFTGKVSLTDFCNRLDG